MNPKQVLMTRAEFERFLASQRSRSHVDGVTSIVACNCGDVNCHGWRLIPKVAGLDIVYEMG